METRSIPNLSPTHNPKAAKRFLGKALNGLKDWEKPEIINTDKAPKALSSEWDEQVASKEEIIPHEEINVA